MRHVLIVPMIFCSLISLSCGKKQSSEIDPPPINTGDASVEEVGPAIKPDAPQGSDAPEPAPPSPTDALTDLFIQNEGAFLIGHKKRLRAIARYASGSQRDVTAEWTLITNEAAGTLEDGAYIRAKKVGKMLVRAAFAGEQAEAEFYSMEPILRHKEDQFWVYRLNRDFLSFNSPWDQVSGNGIVRVVKDMPSFAKDCLDEAREKFSLLLQQASIKERFGALIGGGATAQLIYLVNVVPVDGRRNDLRRLDRDAYFWHWMREDQRPSLAMSRFHMGSWVWEVIASPSECVQPDSKDIQRYLDYVAMRVAQVQKEGRL